jgi:DNA polymerase
MPTSGRGEKKILIVGDHPGESEDREGKQFVGRSGQYLRGILYDCGLDPNRDCVFTNATICYSSDIREHKTALQDCLPNLLKTIRVHQPEIILLLGLEAVSSLVSHLWGESVGDSIAKWVGWRIPVRSNNTWVCCSWNPAYIIRDRDSGKQNRALELHFKRHIREALALSGRPWPNGAPDYAKQIEIILDPVEAAQRLAGYAMAPAIAFDFETTTLKPQGQHAEIVCCGISDGKETIAFPWCAATRDAMKSILEDSNIGKIGANSGFEHVWAAEQADIQIQGWLWDCCLDSHLLDARAGITNVAFQAWCRLGVESYWHHIAPFLESKESGGNSPNRIREVNPYDLALYCGQDALIEWGIAMSQMKEMGVEI